MTLDIASDWMKFLFFGKFNSIHLIQSSPINGGFWDGSGLRGKIKTILMNFNKFEEKKNSKWVKKKMLRPKLVNLKKIS